MKLAIGGKRVFHEKFCVERAKMYLKGQEIYYPVLVRVSTFHVQFLKIMIILTNNYLINQFLTGVSVHP